MEWPFNINFDSSPTLSDYEIGTTHRLEYSITKKVLEFEHATHIGAGGILTPKNLDSKKEFTFGAEIKFMGTRPGFSGLEFGLWAKSKPGVDISGMRVGFATAVSLQMTEFIGTTIETNNATFPASPVIGQWYNIKMEYAFVESDSAIGFGVSTTRLYVDGVWIGERRAISRVSNAFMVPGVAVNAGTIEIRRMYGSATSTIPLHKMANFIPPPTAIKSIERNQPELAGVVWAPNFVRKSYRYLETKKIKGRVLLSNFTSTIEPVFLYENDSMRPVSRTLTDTNGYYEFVDIDPRYEYVTMVIRDGKKKTIPTVRYFGHGSLSGTYSIQGDRVSGATVEAFSEETGEHLGTTSTDSNGQFRIPNLNTSKEFNVVIRDPMGLWEDRVSSRRLPVNAILPNIDVISDMHVRESGVSVGGKIKIIGGVEPYSVESTGLPAGISIKITGDELTFEGATHEYGEKTITTIVRGDDGAAAAPIAIELNFGHAQAIATFGSSTTASLAHSPKQFDIYRILITKNSSASNAGDTRVAMSEFKMFESGGSTNVANGSGATVTASSFLTNYEPNLATDESPSSYWSSDYSGFPHWLEVKFAGPQIIEKILISQSTWTTQTPRDFKIQARRTGDLMWNDLATITDWVTGAVTKSGYIYLPAPGTEIP